MPSQKAVESDYSALMVLETPLLRVSRPVAACSRCRTAKVKCDGKLPACTACEKANKAAECASTNDQFARGKERSYVATLESRVEKLERRLADAQARRKSSVTMADSSPATPRRRSLDAHKLQKAARRKEESDINELVSDFGYLAVNATARDFYGFTAAMSYAQLILASCSEEDMPNIPPKELPARYATQPLIQYYFDNIFTYVPMFEEANVYAAIDAVYDQDRTKATPFDHWMVRMILAITSIGQSEQRNDEHYMNALGHVNAALEFAEEVLHPGSIASIQALLFLVGYAMLDPHHFNSWHLIGVASRAMVDLGIHQDPPKSSLTKNKLEIRRRVFWVVYALDRSTSLVQTRAFSFSDDSCNVKMPFSERGSSPTSKNAPRANLGLHGFNIARDLYKLRKIQSSWYSDLFQSGRNPWPEPYSYIWRIYQEMTDWFNNVSPNTSTPTKVFFELELLYSYVYILSSNPRCPHPSDYAQRLVFEHCITFASKAFRVITETSRTARVPVTFYDMMRAYMTGRQFVDILSRNFNGLLQNVSYTPSATSPAAMADMDPLSSTGPPPPPIPPRPVDEATQTLLDQTARAIEAINDFASILSHLGMRFGYIAWRDRFQRESAQVLAQLYQRQQQQQTSPQPGFENMHPWTPQQQQQDELAQGFGIWDNKDGSFSGSPPPPPPLPGSSSSAAAAAGSVPGSSSSPPPQSSFADPALPPLDNPFANRGGTQVRRGWTALGSAAGGQRFQFAAGSRAAGGGGGGASASSEAVSAAPPGMGNLATGPLTIWETMPGGSLDVSYPQ